MSDKRWGATLRLSNLPYPHFYVCDPDNGAIWVEFCFGERWTDPVFSVGHEFRGWLARPWIAYAGWKWDRAVARQNQVRNGGDHG